MIIPRSLIPPLAASAVLLTSAGARADQPVRVYVDGPCPTRAGFGAALDAEAVATTNMPVPWTVVVESSDEAATLTLLHDRIGRVAQRVTASDDCDAVAEAFAMIVKSLLSVPPPPDPDPAPAAEEGNVRDSSSAGVGDFAAPGATPPAAITATALTAPAPRPITFGASGAVDLRFDDTWARALEVDVAFPIRRSAAARIVADVGEHARAPGNGALLDRRQSSLRAELSTGARSGALWLTAGAGGGVSLFTIGVPTDPNHPVISRLHPIVSSTLIVGVRATDTVSLRAHVGLSVFPVADRYVLPTMGEVGQSPRAQISIGIGAQLHAWD